MLKQGCARCIDARCTALWHSKNVKFLHGFSHQPHILDAVREEAAKARARGRHVVVMHDGSHFKDDVLNDLILYEEFATPG